MLKADLCFAVPGEGHIIDVVNPETGRTWIFGKTLEDCQREHPDAVQMTIEEFSKAKAARQDTHVRWAPTDRETYQEMLEILPPAFWHNGIFLVGEPCDHHALSGRPRFRAYAEKGSAGMERYYVSSRPITVAEARVFANGGENLYIE